MSREVSTNKSTEASNTCLSASPPAPSHLPARSSVLTMAARPSYKDEARATITVSQRVRERVTASKLPGRMWMSKVAPLPGFGGHS